MYVQIQKEIQAFYPRAPDLAVSKCLKRISIKSSPDILNEVSWNVEGIVIGKYYLSLSFFLSGSNSFGKSTSTYGNGESCWTRLCRVCV